MADDRHALDDPHALLARALGQGHGGVDGIDPAVLGAIVEPNLLQPDSEGPEEDGIITAAIRQNLWLAVALGASALSLLAFWAAGPKEESVVEDSPGDEAEAEARPADIPSV